LILINNLVIITTMILILRTLLFIFLWISCCAALSYILGCMSNSFYNKPIKKNRKNSIKNMSNIFLTFTVACAILCFGLLYSFEILSIHTFIQFYVLSIFITLAISEKIYIVSFVQQTLQPCSQPILDQLSRI